MSEDQRITKVVKKKDPRRVEAGKRLGAISRAAKERKARERMEYHDDEPNDGTRYITILTGVGVLTGLVCLYFTYKQDKRAEADASAPVKKTPPDDSQKQSKPISNKLRSLDD